MLHPSPGAQELLKAFPTASPGHGDSGGAGGPAKLLFSSWSRSGAGILGAHSMVEGTQVFLLKIQVSTRMLMPVTSETAALLASAAFPPWEFVARGQACS